MPEEAREALEAEVNEEERETGGWSWGAMLMAGAIGFAVGAAMGILFAPRPGKETREELLHSAQENLERSVLALREQMDALHQQLIEHLRSAEEIAQRLGGDGPRPPADEPDAEEESPEHLIES